MEQLTDKIKGVLENGLEECHAFLEAEVNGRVTGHIVAREFDELTYEQRRKRIRAVIDAAVASGAITAQEALDVSTLLTYTPEEWKVTLPDD